MDYRLFGVRVAFVKLCRVEGAIGLWLGRRSDRLPCFGLPLRSGDEAVPIDLNVLMQMVYESAALDLAIDYGQQPTPGLSQDDFDWVQKTISLAMDRLWWDNLLIGHASGIYPVAWLRLRLKRALMG
jgi:hypothetical protein